MPAIANLRREALVKIWMATTSVLLVVATWSLWWPVASVEFPLVSILPQARAFPLVLDRCLTLSCLIGIAAIALLNIKHSRLAPFKRSGKLAEFALLLSGIGLVLLNQHRLQPWFYQLLIFGALWILVPQWMACNASRTNRKLSLPRGAIGWMQAIVISVYFYSSLGKLDSQFLHTVGQQFLSAIAGIVGWELEESSWQLRLWLAAALPLTELFLAVVLLLGWMAGSRWLSWCSLACAGFHVALIYVLGFQLGHSLGVVLWNVQFAGLAILLFYRVPVYGSAGPRLLSKEDSESSRLSVRPSGPICGLSRFGKIRTLIGSAIALIVAIMPLFERWDYWDHWTSWALYAPHSSRVEVMVAPQAVQRLPRSLQAQLTDAQVADSTNWVRLPLPAWSLEELATPIYPQARFQLVVAQELAARVESSFQIQAVILGPADRFTGKRSERILRGSEAILAEEVPTLAQLRIGK